MLPHTGIATLRYRVGPFTVSLDTNHAPFMEQWKIFYGDLPALSAADIFDFHTAILRAGNLRRWIRPQVNFFIDRETPFEPFSLDLAFPLLEWGLNWSIATRAHAYLMLHSAVLERQGRALLLPALPGSGKSTLCAALALRGWRLFSDEFGLVDPEQRHMLPLPRPVVLKNESIEVIRAFAPEATIGPLFPGTRKGTVAHLRASAQSLARQREPAAPAWVVFPKYRAGSATELRPILRSSAFIQLANNSFNYRLKGESGFLALTALIRQCDCFQLNFSDLQEAIDALGSLPLPATMP